MIPHLVRLEEYPSYYIGDNGSVYWRNAKCELKPVKTYPQRRGHITVLMRNDAGSLHHKSVHRLVASIFVEKHGERHHVNHINNDPSDNRPENLEWVTPKENIQHCMNCGRKPIGEKHQGSVLKECDVRRIRDGNERVSDLAKEYGVKWNTIKAVRNRITWKHLP